VNDQRFLLHPACLETPKSEDLREDVQNLATLRRLCRKTKSSIERPRRRAARVAPVRATLATVTPSRSSSVVSRRESGSPAASSCRAV
jgi:hypothetical protein